MKLTDYQHLTCFRNDLLICWYV